MIIARKIFFMNFGGERHVPPAPISYAYDENMGPLENFSRRIYKIPVDFQYLQSCRHRVLR